jgi:putative DNA primase/helicase
VTSYVRRKSAETDGDPLQRFRERWDPRFADADLEIRPDPVLHEPESDAVAGPPEQGANAIPEPEEAAADFDDELRQMLDDATAETNTQDIEDLTDGHLADALAAERLQGSYCYAEGLGWLHWDGTRWQRTSDREVVNVTWNWVRKHYKDTLAQAAEAMSQGNQGAAGAFERAAKGWRGACSGGRLHTITKLASGNAIVLKDAAKFDQQPDLLNVRNGVVDLRTGQLHAHNPALLFTRIAGVAYNPGAHHVDWDQALKALPDDARDWMQILLGQAASGHASDSDLIPICQGGGKNGKTTLFTGARQALGDYHSLVSDKVLLGNPNDHPTELMDLRGARCALVEETPEEGKLDVQRVKKITGSGELTARYIRGNDVTFPITHTLFVTTNHKPLVNQTDFGTWRRLALIRFPYTFNGPKADPNLRDRVKRTPAVHRAALAWIVEGAKRWYQLDRVTPPPPAAVAADTLEWRTESDSVLAYWIDRLVPDPASHIASLDLLADFNDWLETRGHRRWSDKTLVERLGDHELADNHHVDRKRIRREQAGVGALDRPHAYAAPTPLGTQYQAWLGLRFRTSDDASDLD